jgi:spore maturation protein CgeB
MKLVVFGLTVSSSWGNGHATLWRGFARAWAARGHELVFFERDAPWYASNRDLDRMPGGQLVLYGDWNDVREQATQHVRDADGAMVTSYCPDGVAATELLAGESSDAVRLFYDMDTPVTLENLRAGEPVAYIGPRGLRDFDLVLSFTGGPALDELRERLAARDVRTLYGHVDPQVHRRVAPVSNYTCALSYLGTYAADRQAALEQLFVEPARQLPQLEFLIGGAQYPHDFPWTRNIRFVRHMPPSEHPGFFSSSRWTLNVTRRAMAVNGWCPSGRLFEAAACGTPVITDAWEGLAEFFTPGEEIVVARSTHDVSEALELPDIAVDRIALAAYERVLAQHTSAHRVRELEAMLEEIRTPTEGIA